MAVPISYVENKSIHRAKLGCCIDTAGNGFNLICIFFYLDAMAKHWDNFGDE